MLAHVSAPFSHAEGGDVHMSQLFTSSIVIVIGALLSVLPMVLAQNFPPVAKQKIRTA
jgi:hypothetical protein